MSFTEFLLVVLAGLVTAVVCHELGHLLCARMLKVPVRALYLGAPPRVISFSAGQVRVHVGPLLRGRVTHDAAPAAASAAIVAAGPAVNVLMAGIALGVARHNAVAVVLAWSWGWLGITNLVPFRLSAGRRSDGANLARAIARRRNGAEDRGAVSPAGRLQRLDGLLAGRPPAEIRQGLDEAVARLAAAGRVTGLIAIRDQLKLQEDPARSHVRLVHDVERHLLTQPGLPREIADVAAQRVGWVLAHSIEPESAIRPTLALARYRQGRYAEVEPLCTDALASELTPDQRAAVLATVALARRATSGPYQPVLDEARALAPDAPLVREAAAP